MKRKTESYLVWSGVPFVVLFFVGLLLLAGFVPPPSPNLTATEIAAIYRDGNFDIRLGVMFCFLGTLFFFAFGAGMVGQTRRIPGVSPAVTYFQVASFAAASLIIILPLMCWWTAAFRPESRAPELIQLVNDLGWLTFVVGFTPYVTWAVSAGIAIFADESDDPLFPRWSAYFCVLVGLVQIPPVVLVFVKTGPFAWDGLISWWMPMFDFFSWIVVMTLLSARAAARQGHVAAADTPVARGLV
jgi:hypothetical protein